ncbi:hypothetical protein KKE33_03260 [Patescibacteria group bacterium]|nr:hypothetical protein [Patescibacteria group bacterium]
MRSATVRLPGHPDQACDLVAEAIIDEYLRRDPNSRIRLSVSGGRGVIFVSGDVVSQADFDVSDLIKRTLGSLGITDEVEPLISLEPVTSERIVSARLSSESLVIITGYATLETPDGIPATTSLARRVAKRLHEKREVDPEWFWLGPDAEVTVVAEKTKPSRVIINIEHSSESLDIVRSRIISELADMAPGTIFETNITGPNERRGLTLASGASGRTPNVYGSLIPLPSEYIGHDPFSVEKAGAWLTRQAALKLVNKGACAVLVQAAYLPGDFKPAFLKARDERGNDLSADINLDDLSLDRVMRDWWRTGLNLDAARWGFAGQAGLPWEE